MAFKWDSWGNFDVEDFHIFDPIVHFSGGGAVGDQEHEDDKNEYIFKPPLNIISRVEAIEYMHEALQFAQYQEGTTKKDLQVIERIGQLSSRS